MHYITRIKSDLHKKNSLRFLVPLCMPENHIQYLDVADSIPIFF